MSLPKSRLSGVPARKMDEVDFNLVLDYLKVILTWPVAILILGFTFLYLFKNEIKQFLRDLVTIRQRWPGGGETEFSRKQQELSSEVSGIRDTEKEEELKKEIEKGEQKKLMQITTYLVKQLKETENKLLFENTYNLIYGSQIRLLEHLSKKGSFGDSYQNLYSLFYELASRLYAVLKSYPFASYMNFLENRQLVKKLDNTYIITEQGIAFLNHIDANMYSKNKAY